jgi:quercetin dioxygenase-like cupin family protein
MSLEVYDYRTGQRNLFVRPEMRAQFYCMAPGQIDSCHSHDLGHEVHLVLEGQAEFEIAGKKQVLGPGQLCIIQADEVHQVRNLLPDQPTIMYVSVAPHVHPTGTDRSENGERLPPRYIPNRQYAVEPTMELPLEDLLERLVTAADLLAESAKTNATLQAEMTAHLHQAHVTHDRSAAEAARDAMWQAIYSLHQELYAFDAVWNELAPQALEGTST